MEKNITTEQKQTLDDLLKQHARPNGLMTVQTSFIHMHYIPSVGADKIVSYNDPEIKDTYADGIALYAIIQAQIDANEVLGMEYAWTGYLITPNKTELIYKETAFLTDDAKYDKIIKDAKVLADKYKQGEKLPTFTWGTGAFYS